MPSHSEENYLKAIHRITAGKPDGASTNSIAKKLETKASSVTDMIKRLAEKGLVNYKKYQGVTLTEDGRRVAISIIRKHRLWEVFLVEHLQFKWDEVHDIAEQLEHIQSPELTDRLDNFLGFPKFDPHGDPIPDADGNVLQRNASPLSEMSPGEEGVIVGVHDSSPAFLQYLESQKLVLGIKIKMNNTFDYDHSVSISIDDGSPLTLSNQVSKNLFIKKIAKEV